MPRKKEYVTVKVDNNKEPKQKRLLLVNLKELYGEFKKKNPHTKVGFSKFYELRPKWCFPITASGMHSVCTCKQHQNVKLMVAAVPGQGDYKKKVEKVVCDSQNCSCMPHLCQSCSGKASVETYLSDCFPVETLILMTLSFTSNGFTQTELHL